MRFDPHPHSGRIVFGDTHTKSSESPIVSKSPIHAKFLDVNEASTRDDLVDLATGND
jgi:hypothetical protein